MRSLLNTCRVMLMTTMASALSGAFFLFLRTSSTSRRSCVCCVLFVACCWCRQVRLGVLGQLPRAATHRLPQEYFVKYPGRNGREPLTAPGIRHEVEWMMKWQKPARDTLGQIEGESERHVADVISRSNQSVPRVNKTC